MLQRIVRLFAGRAPLTVALWALLVGFGLLSYTTLMPREGFPSVEVPITVMSGSYFVDDADEVDRLVTLPMVQELLGRDGVDVVDSNSASNTFSVVLSMTQDQTSQDGVDLVEAAVAAVGLPAEVNYEIQAVDAARFFNEYDLLVAVYGPAGTSAEELEDAAVALLPAFEAQGDIERAATIDLIRRGTDPQTGAEVATQARFSQITDDDAQIRPAIAVGVVAAADADALRVRDATDAALNEGLASGAIPEGFDALVAVDFATQIRQQIGSLQSNVLTGLVAVAMIALVLISWRASLIAAVFIATVLTSTMGLLHLAGISLNTISLFGVILALGLFVDDAIVITEAIDAFRHEAQRPLDVIGRAVKRVGSATISGTVTTLLVFAPMLAISGILGSFIRILPISVMIALATSLVLSLLFIPLAARFLILGSEPKGGVLSGFERKVAAGLAQLPMQVGARGARNAVIAVGLAVAMTAIGIGLFLPRVGFNIFPPQKDSIEIEADYGFPPGTTIEEAERRTAEINAAVLELVGDDVEQMYTYIGSSRGVSTRMNLTPIGQRLTAPELVEVLKPFGATIDGVDVNFSQISAGPPASLFPFQAQVFEEDFDVLVSAAEKMVVELGGAAIERENGTRFNVLEAKVIRAESISRRDGRRYVEVVARFDADDVTTVTAETSDFLEERFGPDELSALGLATDALEFDLGLESANQESFASMPKAFGIALVAMLILLVLQFRSTVQWILVFLAIPFSLFGVFGGLLLTDNEISFFVMLGVLALIGIAVNNTILLVDFANQERRAGADRRTAIATAVERRFRPLVATSLTTVAGVLPLALSDPFWESLGYTIIFGLLSSTFLVVMSFPFFYLGMEWLRDQVVTPWRPSRQSEA